MANRAESIEYNGRVYASWEDLPQEARDLIGRAMPDVDGDGVPDVLQGGSVPEPSVTTVRRPVTVDGTTYDSIEDLPPHLRDHLTRIVPEMAPGETRTDRVVGDPVLVRRTTVEGMPLATQRKPWWRRLLG